MPEKMPSRYALRSRWGENLAIACSIIFGLAALALSVWLGIALLTGDSPMNTKNVAAGVVLLVFCWLAALVGALVGCGLGAAVGAPLDCCADNC